MKIVQVCVAEPQIVTFAGRSTETGIFKKPVDGKIVVGLLNLEGDRQADLSVHGGRDKAIYVYSQEHYPTWARELGVADLEPPQFGENLTVTGGVETSVILGDVYRAGSAIVEVAQPRLPCFKLGIRMQDKKFPGRFLSSGRLGFYLRVREQGRLQRGDEFDLTDRPSHGISVHDLWQSVFRDPDPYLATRALELLPYLDPGWQRRLRAVTIRSGDSAPDR